MATARESGRVAAERPAGGPRPVFVVAELTVRDREKLRAYARRVKPLLPRHGGSLLGFSNGEPSVVEGARRADVLVVQRWRSREAFEAFWRSPDYEPLRRLREEAADSQIFVFDGQPGEGASVATETRALSGTYVADPHHSSIVFGVRHMDVSTFRAGFTHFDARLVADAAGLTLEGRAPVESVSIASPPELRDHVVSGTDFFDAGEHPTITFRSTRIQLGDDGNARLEGDLTIKGISRRVTAVGSFRPPVTDPFGGVRAALELHAAVDRREWGMDWQMQLPDGGDALGYEVQLSVQLELTKEA